MLWVRSPPQYLQIERAFLLSVFIFNFIYYQANSKCKTRRIDYHLTWKKLSITKLIIILVLVFHIVTKYLIWLEDWSLCSVINATFRILFIIRKGYNCKHSLRIPERVVLGYLERNRLTHAHPNRVDIDIDYNIKGKLEYYFFSFFNSQIYVLRVYQYG